MKEGRFHMNGPSWCPTPTRKAPNVSKEIPELGSFATTISLLACFGLGTIIYSFSHQFGTFSPTSNVSSAALGISAFLNILVRLEPRCRIQQEGLAKNTILNPGHLLLVTMWVSGRRNNFDQQSQQWQSLIYWLRTICAQVHKLKLV